MQSHSPGEYMIRILSVFLLSALTFYGVAHADIRHFEGEVVFNGDALPVRLHVSTEDAVPSTLDIPQLWYAEEPLPASMTEDGSIALTFPFGLGDFILAQDGDAWINGEGAASIVLTESAAPPYRKVEVSFGGHEPHVGGTLYLPEGEGPFPAIVLVGGASSNQRSQWSYRSRADYCARLGVAALTYDRRDFGLPLESGALPDLVTQAEDLVAAREMLAARSDIDSTAIGIQAGSQGVWLATNAQGAHGGFAFLILTGVPAVTPAQSQFQTMVHGMRDDGMPETSIANAIAYLRLYFYVAQTGEGWDTLEAAMDTAVGEDWYQYVDQPRTLEDLNWWNRVMTYEPREDLTRITIPILAMWGSADWVTPPVENLPLVEEYARVAGNHHVRTMIAEGADHRLERQPYTDADGQWHWFEVAREARDAISAFLRDDVGLVLRD